MFARSAVCQPSCVREIEKSHSTAESRGSSRVPSHPQTPVPREVLLCPSCGSRETRHHLKGHKLCNFQVNLGISAAYSPDSSVGGDSGEHTLLSSKPGRFLRNQVGRCAHLHLHMYFMCQGACLGRHVGRYAWNLCKYICMYV